MTELVHDLRLGLRHLLKTPGFTLAAVVSLAVGIGANTTTFTLARAILSLPFALEKPEQVLMVYGSEENPAADDPFNGFLPASFPNLRDLAGQNEVFAHMAALHANFLGLTSGEGEPEQITGEFVTADYFDVFGFQPAAGGFFADSGAAASPGSHPTVVLSHGLWSRRFGRDPGVVGRTIQLNGHPLTVLGVAPEGFHGTTVSLNIEAFIHMSMFPVLSRPPLPAFFENRAAQMFFAVARLKEGMTPERAAAHLEGLGRGLRQDYPEENKDLEGFRLVQLAQATVNPGQRDTYVRAGGLLAAVAAILLLIACANVANLLLTRAVGRRQEFAVRLAMGAGRRRLFQQLLAESFLLALLSSAVAIPVALASLRLLWYTRGWIHNVHGGPLFADHVIPLAPDLRMLAFTLGLGLVTNLVFGLVPAWRASRPDLVGNLRDRTAHQEVVLGGGLRARHLLVAGQMALSLVALICAGLFLRSLREAQAIDPGFRVDGIGLMSFSPGIQGYDEAKGRQLYREVVPRAESLPGIEKAALAEVRPLSINLFRNVQIEGRASDERNLTQTNTVGLGYFELLEIPLVRGRTFSAEDREDTRPVAVVNETTARGFWPGQDPLGKRFSFSGEDRPIEVVGVVEDAKYLSLSEEPRPYIYLPLEQRYVAGITLLFRTGGDPGAALPAVRGEVQTLAPDLPLVHVQELEQVIGQALGGQRMGALLLSVYSSLSLLLALVGIYGVMAYSVARRYREIGLRMALGADRGSVLAAMLKEGLWVSCLGVAVGLALAWAVTRLIAGFLYGVTPLDPATLVLTPLLLLATALSATGLPALRAARIDPMKALRYE